MVKRLLGLFLFCGLSLSAMPQDDLVKRVRAIDPDASQNTYEVLVKDLHVAGLTIREAIERILEQKKQKAQAAINKEWGFSQKNWNAIERAVHPKGVSAAFKKMNPFTRIGSEIKLRLMRSMRDARNQAMATRLTPEERAREQEVEAVVEKEMAHFTGKPALVYWDNYCEGTNAAVIDFGHMCGILLGRGIVNLSEVELKTLLAHEAQHIHCKHPSYSPKICARAFHKKHGGRIPLLLFLMREKRKLVPHHGWKRAVGSFIQDVANTTETFFGSGGGTEYYIDGQPTYSVDDDKKETLLSDSLLKYSRFCELEADLLSFLELKDCAEGDHFFVQQKENLESSDTHSSSHPLIEKRICWWKRVKQLMKAEDGVPLSAIQQPR